MDMSLEADKKSQETAKAETLAQTMKTLGLAAFAPSRNTWAAGPEVVPTLVERSGAVMLGANLTGAPAEKWKMLTIGGLKLGIIGVAAPDKAKTPLDKVVSAPPISAVAEGVAAAK
jgi:hypothetical protein